MGFTFLFIRGSYKKMKNHKEINESTWKGYLLVQGMGRSVHTISTHLILDSSMDPFTTGFL